MEQKCVGRELLTPVEAGLPGLHVLLPTAAFDAWASVPGSALSTRPPILVGQVGGQRVPGQSKNNAGASAEVGVPVSPETTLFSSRMTTWELTVIRAGFLAPSFEDEEMPKVLAGTHNSQGLKGPSSNPVIARLGKLRPREARPFAQGHTVSQLATGRRLAPGPLALCRLPSLLGTFPSRPTAVPASWQDGALLSHWFPPAALAHTLRLQVPLLWQALPTGLR